MKRFFIFLLGVAILFSANAYADPGAGAWLNTNGAEIKQVDSRTEALYSFTTAVNSKVLRVTATSDVCFDTDTSSSSIGAARVTILRAVDPNNALAVSAIDVSSSSPVPSDMSNCVVIQPASYWIRVDTGRSASQTPLVVVRGR